jgi:hypothetical protein
MLTYEFELKISVVSSGGICRKLIGIELMVFGCVLEEKSRLTFLSVAEGPALNWQANRSVWLSAIALCVKNKSLVCIIYWLCIFN